MGPCCGLSVRQAPSSNIQSRLSWPKRATLSSSRLLPQPTMLDWPERTNTCNGPDGTCWPYTSIQSSLEHAWLRPPGARSVNPTERTRVRSGVGSHGPSVTVRMSSRRHRVLEKANSLIRHWSEAGSACSLTSHSPPSNSRTARNSRNPDCRLRQRTVAVPARSISPPSESDRLTAQGSLASPDQT